MNYRYDNRTKEEFSKNIKDASILQSQMISLWKDEMLYKGLSVDIEDNGCDNSGGYLDKASNAPDYRIRLLKGRSFSNDLYEVKTAPHYDKYYSFKVDSLTSCIYYNAYILVFGGVAPNRPIDLDKLRWSIISPQQTAQILNTYPITTNGYLFGGKPIVQIPAKDFSKWFYLHKFDHLRN